ncbi:MAG: hypothetical protein COV10_03920 [Candidatus Vogelbacteria bacterium CG10_big_fil_rev_8_21_14_0_10_51_16]|uniref:Uncharacterized protein n=1 Tax=Candidatus Vogelbacteria bacterium CG10_big_fil_rev_8_21_14_0_10_51_16 TaxID=1975045 RepID=A0A2H0RDJ3_9BACT|nr:MAG: hypothetical protein COV10_03920 [Candidatus Vogelbacteria bacterium CG10_big_fil_rev_8_21_14_0_10_51_16]
MATKIAEKLILRYSHLTRPNESARVAAQIALKSVLKIDIPITKISVERGTVFIRIPQLIKSEVAIHKVDILAALKERLGSHAPKDIR